MATSPVSFDLSLNRAISDLEDVSNRMSYILPSLLACFDKKKSCFYTFLMRDEPPDSGTFRDTAIVLTAIEKAAKDLMNFVPVPPDEAKFEAQLRSALVEGKVEPIYHDYYREFVFFPALNTIAQKPGTKSGRHKADPKEILDSHDLSLSPLFPERDAFTCSRILQLLNLFSSEDTHSLVWLEAVEEVVGSLVRSRPPHYSYGGASIDKNKAPDAFVSYYCIGSLLGIESTLGKRSKEHQEFANLIQQFLRWLEPASKDRLIYPDWKSYSAYLKLRLEELGEAVGIAPMVSAASKLFEGWEPRPPQSDPDPETVCNELLAACRDNVVNWLSAFSNNAKESILKLAKPLEEPIPKDSSHTERRGEEWMEVSREFDKRAGISWQLAFFWGMPEVLDAIVKIYSKLPGHANGAKGLASLAEAIGKAGKAWAASERITHDYIVRFARWARAELRRQITFHTVPSNNRVDPVQLAFSLRIVHDLVRDGNRELIEKGIQILAEIQNPDGTWPIGAPLMTDPSTEAGIYVVNLEIANAIVPMIQTNAADFGSNYRLLQRVHNWLKVNERRIRPKGLSSENYAIIGWTSDKVFNRKRVDVWIGGLALEFLHSYQTVLQQYVNRETVREKYQCSRPRGPAWTDLVDSQLVEDYSKRISTHMLERYIQPFDRTGESRNSAMVLYGPPGTGKTTYAEAIAASLNWDLVTITPSDFVKEGIEKSENLARTLFQDLMHLRDVVVLFDEIDEMLRSRSSEKEKSQIAMLQFLIPGMLPKLQNLKKHGEKRGLIFIIATNYRERLDPAIVRAGRIDDHFAVLPPDHPSRCCILHKMLGRKGTDCMPAARVLADLTHGWVYKELDNLVASLNEPTLRELRRGNPDGLKIVKIGDDPWMGRKIAGIQRALDPERLYAGRPEAVDEARLVLEICWPEIPPDRLVADAKRITGAA